MHRLSLPLAALLLASCRPVPKLEDGIMEIGADNPAVSYTGRWDRSHPEAPQASWPGFGIATGFTGTSIGIDLEDAGNYYNVHIDGELHGIVHSTGKKREVLVLAKGLAQGAHTLRLVRRNISFDNPTVIHGFLVDTGCRLSPAPAAKKLKIEFIGDSFTAAEGNEAKAPTLPWKEKYPVTDFENGFAAMIARDLDAELLAVCRSGNGVLCDWQGSRSESMVDRYGRALMDREIPSWDFSRWTPDLVVISLGLNDHTGLEGPGGGVTAEDSGAFRQAYHRLAAMVRSHYPQAEIVALAPYTPWSRENISRVVAERRNAGDSRIRYAQFDEYPGGYVADGHPTVKTHRMMADSILPQLPPLPGSGS